MIIHQIPIRNLILKKYLITLLRLISSRIDIDEGTLLRRKRDLKSKGKWVYKSDIKDNEGHYKIRKWYLQTCERSRPTQTLSLQKGAHVLFAVVSLAFLSFFS
jgi:hypothetical protein